MKVWKLFYFPAIIITIFTEEEKYFSEYTLLQITFYYFNFLLKYLFRVAFDMFLFRDSFKISVSNESKTFNFLSLDTEELCFISHYCTL